VTRRRLVSLLALAFDAAVVGVCFVLWEQPANVIRRAPQLVAPIR
jgi:hypothetical protein